MTIHREKANVKQFLLMSSILLANRGYSAGTGGLSGGASRLVGQRQAALVVQAAVRRLARRLTGRLQLSFPLLLLGFLA